MKKLLKRPELIGKKILFVMAHPDDESFLAAGTAYRNAMAGGTNFLICATSGEKGRSHLLAPVTESELKRIRKSELREVCNFLKVKRLIFLELPDGGLKGKRPLLYKKVLELASVLRPDYILSFDRDGVSGHLDHITISSVSKQAAKKIRVSFVGCCAPPVLAKNFGKTLLLRRKFGKYSAAVEHVRPNLIIKIDPKVKMKALGFHKSQLDQGNPFNNLGSHGRRQIMNYEYFRTYR